MLCTQLARDVLFQGTHFSVLLNNWEQRKVWRSEACRDLCGAIRRKSLSTIWGWGGPLCLGTEWLSECGADGEVRESSAREVCNTEHASGPGLQHALVLVGQVWMMIWRVLSCSLFSVLNSLWLNARSVRAFIRNGRHPFPVDSRPRCQ